jgi:hypothetical protein
MASPKQETFDFLRVGLPAASPYNACGKGRELIRPGGYFWEGSPAAW